MTHTLKSTAVIHSVILSEIIKALLLRAFQTECGTFIQQFFVYIGQVEDIFFTLSSILYTIPDAPSSSK